MNNNPLFSRFRRRPRRAESLSLLRLTLYGMVASFAADFLLSLFQTPLSLFELFYFNPFLIRMGHFWRFLTFPFVRSPGAGFSSLIWFGFSMLIYHVVITTLEAKVGRRRANVFAILCWLTLGGYGLLAGRYVDFSAVILGITALAGLYNPQFTIYFYFFIPVKGLVLGILGMALMVYNGVTGSYEYLLILALLLLLNFETVTAFISGKKRQQEYTKKVKAKRIEHTPRHRCTVCSRTEKDVPNMSFRFCSQCEGNFEYCEDHIANHEHRSNIVPLEKKQ